MKQLRLTLIVSCSLIILGILIILQSDYVKSDHKAEAFVYSIEEDGPTPTLAHTRQAVTGQMDLIAAEFVENATTMTRKTGFVFSSDQSQIAFNTEVSGKTKAADGGNIGTDVGEKAIINQSDKNNEPGTPPMDDLPLENPDTGGSVEKNVEPLISIESVRLAAPLHETEASNWLENGNENGNREDPIPFIWPAEERWLSGYNYSSMHPGIDIAAKSDDLIFAAASGKVVEVHHSYYGYGNMLIIDHFNGYQTLYAHLNTILAEMDDFVIQGQPIGLAGNTGNSTGTHLHFEIHYQGRFVNPWLFLTR